MACEVSLGHTFFAKLDSEVRPIWHLYVSKESATFVRKYQLDCDFTLEKGGFGKAKSIVCVLKQSRLVLVLGHGPDTE